MSTTMEPEPLPIAASKPCERCGNAVPYESIMIMGKEFGGLLARFCDPCSSALASEQAATEAEQARQRIEAAIAATIPPELLETRTDDPRFNLDLWKVVRHWTPGPDAKWLGIIGPPGCCKTRVLALLAKRGIRAGQRVVWTSAVRIQDEVETLRDSKAHARRTLAREHLDDCHRAAVLILDDIGKNTWPADFERHFYSILNHRRDFRLPVLWSSNVRPIELSHAISAVNAGPIIGRLQDRTTIADLFD